MVGLVKNYKKYKYDRFYKNCKLKFGIVWNAVNEYSTWFIKALQKKTIAQQVIS